MNSSKYNRPIVVAMSGGVDSSAAALLLREQGYEVIGVSMQVWDYRNHGGNSGRATCCAPADFDDARQVSELGSFPFYVFDFEDSFKEKVIDPFVNSYLQGLTPNPCLDCNRKVKFRELRKRAKSLGADVVATGHYAQIFEKADGTLGLYTSTDERKDQSYFLYALTQDELSKTLFPVGGMEKSEVRQFLEEKGLTQAQKEESQDICFVSSSVASFVEKNTTKVPQAGKFLNRSGETLGEHSGIHNFTVGQRKGLGLSNPNPLYVLQIDSQTNEVVVGEKDELEQSSFIIRDINWISGTPPSSPVKLRTKLRYRHSGVVCEITPEGDGRALARFDEEWSAVSPGQAAVFYGLDERSDGYAEVVGGGIIER